MDGQGSGGDYWAVAMVLPDEDEAVATGALVGVKICSALAVTPAAAATRVSVFLHSTPIRVRPCAASRCRKACSRGRVRPPGFGMQDSRPAGGGCCSKVVAPGTGVYSARLTRPLGRQQVMGQGPAVPAARKKRSHRPIEGDQFRQGCADSPLFSVSLLSRLRADANFSRRGFNQGQFDGVQSGWHQVGSWSQRPE